MAFDDSTRNRLNGVVGSARDLLVAEFTWQLNQTYGLDPATGAVTDLDKLGHLDDQRLETARILREIMAHYLGAVVTPSAKQRAQVLDRILREQAFTVLNRLAALRLMEARGILIESVAKGYRSKAFQLYRQVAGTALGETGDTYRIFLFSLFDMFAADLPGLFDRYSPMGRLFPREPAFLDLLALMNAPDLEPLWGEDETIGWIYQYFNSAEERKRMRKESAAPRDSRELAVRNQFFTPRYVVEFLVDNTLGRQWVNMTGGRTRLMEDRRYLVYTPDEVFLGRMSAEDEASARIAKALLDGRWDDLPDFDDPRAGRQAMIEFAHCVDAYSRHPDGWGEYFGRLQPVLHGMRFDGATTQELWDGLFLECRADRHGGDGSVHGERWFRAAVEEILTRLKREDLAKRPTLVAFRALRDPRTIRLLDPACGSMHFGLYAFDVFEVIYREAWAIELAEGPQRLERPVGMAPLSATYADEQAYLRDVPRLIIEHNIWGVDIDPRAAQIASLALWLRAQRAWNEMGVVALERPAVGKGNVMAAVAPPAEADLRETLKAEMNPLDAQLFERTLILLKNLSELGVLLKTEEEIPRLVRSVYPGHGPVFERDDEARWLRIELRLQEHLLAFSRASSATYRRRLFSADAMAGLKLIDLVHLSFDAVVMNPPFGALSAHVKDVLSQSYPRSKSDLLAIFVERGLDFVRAYGRLGAITSRTCFFLTSFYEWREEVVLGAFRPELMADLGFGVMDDAMVEAAAYVLERRA
jgi:hypothetical protein